jgi:two-component system response regulator AtoC
LSEEDQLLPEYFAPELGTESRKDKMDGVFDGYSIKAARRIMEEELITRALKATKGNRTKAARILEISHPSLVSKIKTYNILL